MTDTPPGGGDGVPENVWRAPTDLVGTILADRYQINSVLGDGGMGRVYEAVHTTLRKKVALKVLKQELCSEQVHVDRFLQEARAASMIGHENIVDIIDFGPVPGGSVFMAMEYLEGEDLSEVIKNEGRIPWPRARGLLLQIVRALKAAHNKGIIHRDLKPANCFLIKRSSGREFVKLLDFGIAKVTDPDGGAGGLTRTGAVFGTAKYMAPEQAMGEKVDQRTDIYALGVVVYEFLTGRVPYPGDNFMRVLSMHLHERLPLPSEVAPEAQVPKPVEDVIIKALAKSASERYQDMQEFEDAILEINEQGQLMRDPTGEMPATVPPGPETMPPGAEGPESTVAFSAADVPKKKGTLVLDMANSGGQPVEKTMAMDFADMSADDLPPEGGTIRMGQPAVPETSPPQSASAPQQMAATGPPPARAPTDERVPTDTHDTAGFTAPERKSKTGFIAAIIGGAVVAVGGAAAVAMALLSEPDEAADPDASPVATSEAPAKTADPPKPLEQPPEPIEPEIPDPAGADDGGPVVEPTPEQPEPAPEQPEPAPEQPEANPTPAQPPPTGGTTRRTPRGPKATLTSKDIKRGLKPAHKAAKRCAGALPGMVVKVTYTVAKSSGQVFSATPKKPHTTPFGRCVAKALKSKSKFPKTRESGLHTGTESFRF